MANKLTPVVESKAIEFKVGPFIVRVSNKQHYKLYTMHTPDMQAIGKQASYPAMENCLDSLSKAASQGLVDRSIYSNIHRMPAILKFKQERMKNVNDLAADQTSIKSKSHHAKT